MGHAGIVAAHHTGNSPDPTIDDIVVQGAVGGAEDPAQKVVNRFVAESHDPVLSVGRDFHIGLAVLKILDRLHQDFLRHIWEHCAHRIRCAWPLRSWPWLRW